MLDKRSLYIIGEHQLKRQVTLTDTTLTLLAKVGAKGAIAHYLVAANVGVCPDTRIEIYLKGVDQQFSLFQTGQVNASSGTSVIYTLMNKVRLPAGVEIWAKSTVTVPAGIIVEVSGRHIGNPPAYQTTGAIV